MAIRWKSSRTFFCKGVDQLSLMTLVGRLHLVNKYNHGLYGQKMDSGQEKS